MLNFLPDAVEMVHGQQRLFRYVFQPQTPADEAPRPYFHPVCTLRGVVVTEFRPPDHRWHHGISFTIPDLGGVNFWGGPTDIPDQGYRMLANHGRVVHVDWDAVDGIDKFTHQLHWFDPQGGLLLHETRCIQSTVMNDATWQFDFYTTLSNRSEQPLVFKAWRAGYGGLFWRGTPAFMRRWLSSSETPIMGRRAPRLYYSSDSATIILEDQPENPNFPNAWFSRGDDEGYVGACFGLFYARPYALSTGGVVRLHYRLFISDTPLRPEDSTAEV
jgi:hypothetical protein